MATKITSTLLDQSIVDTRAAEVQKIPYDMLPESITYKLRRLTIAVKNKTQFNVQISKSRNWSGRYGSGPSSIAPFSQMMYTTCNSDYAITSGTTGFETYRILIDGKTNWFFTMARCLRMFGSAEACVIEGEDEIKAWNACVTENTECKSQTFAGVDDNGQAVNFYLHISATPGWNAVINISQIMG